MEAPGETEPVADPERVGDVLPVTDAPGERVGVANPKKRGVGVAVSVGVMDVGVVVEVGVGTTGVSVGVGTTEKPGVLVGGGAEVWTGVSVPSTVAFEMDAPEKRTARVRSVVATLLARRERFPT